MTIKMKVENIFFFADKVKQRQAAWQLTDENGQKQEKELLT